MVSIASLHELKAWLEITDDDDDFKLQLALDSATDWITNHTGRTFVLAEATRTYLADDLGQVEVVDLVTVTSVKTDTSGNRTFATTLSASDYELLPRNESRYQRIRIWPTSSQSFGQGRLVQVVGEFGYVENDRPPAAVKQACLILATRYFKRDDAPFGILSATDIGQFERLSKEDPDVISLLAPYRAAGESAAWVMV
jgi:hypothetical protein